MKLPPGASEFAPIPLRKVAEMLSANGMEVTIRSLYRARASGKLNCLKIGGKLGVLPSDLKDFISRSQDSPNPSHDLPAPTPSTERGPTKRAKRMSGQPSGLTKVDAAASAALASDMVKIILNGSQSSVSRKAKRARSGRGDDRAAPPLSG